MCFQTIQNCQKPTRNEVQWPSCNILNKCAFQIIFKIKKTQKRMMRRQIKYILPHHRSENDTRSKRNATISFLTMSKIVRIFGFYSMVLNTHWRQSRRFHKNNLLETKVIIFCVYKHIHSTYIRCVVHFDLWTTFAFWAIALFHKYTLNRIDFISTLWSPTNVIGLWRTVFHNVRDGDQSKRASLLELHVYVYR